MNPNWAYPVEDYDDIIVGTGMSSTQLAANYPNTYGLCDGPETPGKPNLVVESQGAPPSITVQSATTSDIYLCTAAQYIGQSPPHPPGR